MNAFKPFNCCAPFKPFKSPTCFLPRGAGEEWNRRIERLKPLKRFERSAAVERNEVIERLEQILASDEGARSMPFKDPDPTDPNMLVGVMLPADADAMRDMAYVFAEEFARMGHSREQLLWLFKNPFYGGAHGAYRSLGEQATLAIIDECLNVWGNLRVSVQDVPTPTSFLPRDAEEESGGGLNAAQRLNRTK
jgi:hypothetical protein